MDTFPSTWIPLEGASGSVKFRVRSTPFGDGYSQEVPDGLNPIDRSWPVSYQGEKADIESLMAWLDAHVGQKFIWTPPLGVQGTYKCLGYDQPHQSANNWNLNVTFSSSYAP